MSSQQPEKFLKVNIDLKELDSTYETQASTVISKFSYTSCNNVLDFSNEDNYIEALDDAMKELFKISDKTLETFTNEYKRKQMIAEATGNLEDSLDTNSIV